VTIDPGGPNERDVDALADAAPVQAGEVIRIRTTGGGGWGDPLQRDPALVVRDVVWEKVSPSAALDAYGVVLTGSVDDDSLAYDAAATTARRTELATARDESAFFDRGPGYAHLSGGNISATYDWLGLPAFVSTSVDKGDCPRSWTTRLPAGANMSCTDPWGQCRRPGMPRLSGSPLLSTGRGEGVLSCPLPGRRGRL
jgi:hypothetical protein